MSNSMFKRWFSALLVPVVNPWLLDVMEVIALKCFSNVLWSLFSQFFECSMFIKSFWRLQHSRKSCSKFQLSARMKRKNLSLDEKMKAIDYANKNPKMGCRVIAEHFSIGKTCVSNILRNGNLFKGNMNFSKEVAKNWDAENTN